MIDAPTTKIFIDGITEDNTKDIISLELFSDIDAIKNLRIASTAGKKLVDACSIKELKTYFLYLQKSRPEAWKNNPLKLLIEECNLWKSKVPAAEFGLILAALRGDFDRIAHIKQPGLTSGATDFECALRRDHPELFTGEVYRKKFYAMAYANGHALPEYLDKKYIDEIKKYVISADMIGITGNVTVLGALDQEGYTKEMPQRWTSSIFQYGHIEAVEWVLPKLLDHVKNDYNKATSISLAVQYGHLHIVELLFNSIQDMSHYNDQIMGNYLYNAANHGHFEIVKFLLEKYDNVSLYKKIERFSDRLAGYDRTIDALGIVKTNGYADIVKLLEEHRNHSRFQRVKAMLVSVVSGIMGAITFGWSVLTVIATMFVTLGARLILKERAYTEYENKSEEEIQALNPDLKAAFTQGVKSQESIWEQLKSCNPSVCYAACVHWKAYYAGLQAAEVGDQKRIAAVRGNPVITVSPN